MYSARPRVLLSKDCGFSNLSPQNVALEESGKIDEHAFVKQVFHLLG